MYVELFKEILKQDVSADDNKALRQPERHILVSYKTFTYLLARVEAIAAPIEDQVNALATARMAELTTEREEQWAERIEAYVNGIVSERIATLTAELEKHWNNRIAGARIRYHERVVKAQG
jgi:hypothetical protein